MTTQPAIEVQGLRKVFPGGVEAVRGIDFEVAAGEVFSLLGPNGAGKSTTIGMLTATVSPTAGTARLAGFDVASQSLAARRISSVLFQDPAIDLPLTGRRNLEIHARLWGVAKAESTPRIGELVAAFDLAELADRSVGTYSGGERRRLEIARALVSEPRVLFLDEPTVGLDPLIRHELLDVIGGLTERTEMTIMLTTHYLDEAERLSDRIAIMRDGLIAAIGTPQDLIGGLGPELVELRVSGNARGVLASLRAGGLAGQDAFAIGSTLIVPARERSEHVMEEIAGRGFATISIVRRRPTLEDVYLSLTAEPLEIAT